MDDLQKAQQMFKIKLIQKKMAENKSLEQMALELMLAGNDKTQIAQILIIRENLNPTHKQALEMILAKFH